MTHKLLLAAVMVTALCLRLFAIDIRPPGFTPDEAAFGYNAYSLLLTGRDEWSDPFFSLFSHNLRSFGDYKLPLYAFLSVPAVKFLGLSEFSTRLPNAVAGTLAVLVVYVLARRLSRTALLPAFVLAVMPWHISLSRGAFEANLATLFVPLALVLLLSRRPLASAVFFALSFYSYHSARYLIFLFIPLSVYWFRSSRKQVVGFLTLLLLLISPGIWGAFSGSASRVADVSIAGPALWSAVSDTRFDLVVSGLPDPLARLISNKFTGFLTQFTSNLLSYFSPQFLFTSGAGEGTYGMMPGHGAAYLIWLIPAALFSLSHWPLLVFYVLSFVPAALSVGPGYAANRAAVAIPFLALIIGIGLSRLRPRYQISVIVITLISLGFFVTQYYYLSPGLIGEAMLSGRREMVSRVMDLSSNYREVQVSRTLSEPHIYFAFYTAYPPAAYQKNSASWREFEARGLKFLDQLDGYYLDKFRFGDLKFDRQGQGVLYVGRPQEFDAGWDYHFQITNSSGRPVIQVSDKRL